MVKNLKVTFKIKQLYRILGPEKSRRLTALKYLRSVLCERVGLKAWDSFDATESSRQAMLMYVVGKKLHYF